MFEMSASAAWFTIGAACMALEALGVPGIGFLFAGLAAVITGTLVLADVLGADALALQLALWLALTVAAGVALWKPLKRWRMNPGGSDRFSNMIGDTAVVTGGTLTAGFPGKAKWSGTTMVAELAPGAEEIPEGARAEIVEVRGTVLVLKPRSLNA